MIQEIPFEAYRALYNLCEEKANEIAMSGIEGTASTQMAVRRIASRVTDYALDPGTSFGVIEVAFSNKPWKGLNELYLEFPTIVRFRNFTPEKDDIDQNTLLVQHLIVVIGWSNAIKVFKATIENENIHLMLYSAVKSPKI